MNYSAGQTIANAVIAPIAHAPSAAVSELRQAFSALPDDPACGHRRALLTPDPLLPQPVAAVAAFHVLTGERLDPSWVHSFVDSYRGRGPEAECADGNVD